MHRLTLKGLIIRKLAPSLLLLEVSSILLRLLGLLCHLVHLDLRDMLMDSLTPLVETPTHRLEDQRM